MSNYKDSNIKDKIWSNHIVATVVLVVASSVAVWQFLDSVYETYTKAEVAKLLTAKDVAENTLRTTKNNQTEKITLLNLKHESEMALEKVKTREADIKINELNQTIQRLSIVTNVSAQPVVPCEKNKSTKCGTSLTVTKEELRSAVNTNKSLLKKITNVKLQLLLAEEKLGKLFKLSDIIHSSKVTLLKNESKVLFDGQLKISLINIKELFSSSVKFSYTFQQSRKSFTNSGLQTNESIAQKDTEMGNLYVFIVLSYTSDPDEVSFEITQIKYDEKLLR